MSRAAALVEDFEMLLGDGIIDGYVSMSPGRVGPWLVHIDQGSIDLYLDNKQAAAFIQGALAAKNRLRA